jgi:hypothetical protein
MTAPEPVRAGISPPEPDLTPREMLRRADSTLARYFRNLAVI